MKTSLLIVTLLIGHLVFTQSQPKKPIQHNYLIIGSVASKTKPAKFYQVNDTKVINNFINLFVDTLPYYFGVSPYDHRVELYSNSKIVQTIYVNESNNDFSIHGSNKIQNGIVLNNFWQSLIPNLVSLESESYSFTTAVQAESFYQFAKSKQAIVSTPYFCNWRAYEGELIMNTTQSGDAISLDSLREFIKHNYPSYEFKIESMDFQYSEYHHPKQVKIQSSLEFFNVFQFRNRRFKENTESKHMNLISIGYTPFNLYTPIEMYSPIKDSIKSDSVVYLELNFKENYKRYQPIVEVLGPSHIQKELKNWLKINTNRN